ncbi:MAG: CHASE2 domain-containing protein, partial [Candidatus Rokuibacteriota bacterium]
MAFRLTGPRGRVYLIATAVIVIVLALFLWAPEFLQAVEVRLYDLHFKLRGSQQQTAERIVIAAIDEKSLAALGRWPLPRSLMADLIRKLSADGASIIAVDILLSEPEVSGELRAAAQLSERLRTLGLSGRSAGSAVQRELDAFAREADRDRRLAAAVRDSGRVILPIVFEVGPDRSGPPPEPSGAAFKSALVSFRHRDERALYPPPVARSATPPIPVLGDAAKTLGHVTMLADRDGTTRWEAVTFEHQGHYYPSLAVQAVRLATGVDPTRLTLDFGRNLMIGSTSVPL